jgi:hypothetical protein
MPYQVKKMGDYFQLFNLSQKRLVNVKFKSKESAINQAQNWMRFRKEKPIVKGNRILNANKINTKNKKNVK